MAPNDDLVTLVGARDIIQIPPEQRSIEQWTALGGWEEALDVRGVEVQRGDVFSLAERSRLFTAGEIKGRNKLRVSATEELQLLVPLCELNGLHTEALL